MRPWPIEGAAHPHEIEGRAADLRIIIPEKRRDEGASVFVAKSE